MCEIYHEFLFNLEESMNFVKPRKTTKKTISCELSLRTVSILDYYSRYTQYSIDEILDKFLLNILDDENFIAWVNKQRYNKKIVAALYSTPDAIIEEADTNEAPKIDIEGEFSS